MNFWTKNIINKKIYFVGIKGIAMSALAQTVKDAGAEVSGSDVNGHFPSDYLLKIQKIPVYSGFKEENIKKAKPDLVIYTGAHQGSENIEVKYCQRQGIKILPHGRALGEFFAQKKLVSVAGCHGKTTTAAMISTILTEMNFNPSYAIGCGFIDPIGLPGKFNCGEWAVAEADEYATDPLHDLTPRFLWQNPQVAVITNIDYDHPDVYRDLGQIKLAYNKFCQLINKGGVLIYNGDDPNSDFLSKKSNSVSVGQKAKNNYQIINIRLLKGRTNYELNIGKRKFEVTLSVPGEHNIYNSALAIAACQYAGVDLDKAGEAIKKFTGTMRRLEVIRQKSGKVFIDDYAHHPNEIISSLTAIRTWYGNKKILTVFEPHTYSRTKSLFLDFVNSFKNTDEVIFPPIYASKREKPDLTIDSQMLTKACLEKNITARFFKKPGYIKKYIQSSINNHDIIIMMGAGDIYNWGRKMVKELII